MNKKYASSLANAAALYVTLFVGGPTGTLSSVVLWAYSNVSSAFDANRPVEATTMSKSYLQTKTCSIYTVAGYVPYVQVGMRKQFRYQIAFTRDKAGQPMKAKDREFIGVPSEFPQNQDRAPEYKAYFNDDNWIKNKAISIWSTNGKPHLDIYGLAIKALYGWYKLNGYWYYYNNGVQVTGWQQPGGQWYYFDLNGRMQKGWLSNGGYWYYLRTALNTPTSGPEGSMCKGWIKVGGYWYYLRTSKNVPATGPEGGMLAGNTWTIGGKKYTFDSSGRCTTPNGF